MRCSLHPNGGLAFLSFATHFTGSIGYYLCLLCKHNSTWIIMHIHACTNKTHSLENLQDLIPNLASIIIGNTN